MAIVSTVVGAALLLGTIGLLTRTVARDGHGSGPAPRSHVEEVGSWAVQELQR